VRGERTFTETARGAQIVTAALATIAELGYGQASLARIAERIGVSKGVISYHFAGKEELVHGVIADVIAKAVAYMRPRVEAESTGRGKLQAAIESNVAFMGEYRQHMVAVFEIAVNTRGAGSSPNPALARMVQDSTGATRELLAAGQATGEFRPDFDPQVMATAIRAAIDVVPRRLVVEPGFDVRHYGRELADIFDLATRSGEEGLGER
jgi:TetR/AcrR family transcriptional regulator, fatty acid metabolism regulator protein